MFEEKRKISDVAINILKKRYFRNGETTWEELVDRVIGYVLRDVEEEQKELTKKMIQNRYFIPNSPCLVNSGKNGTGLLACFVVDFPDNIEGIYETKLNFAKIARKGGGCGTYLGKIRPEGSRVAGSTHGYAGGPLKFADTISHDMDALTQSGFRAMAIMLVHDIYHPDIVKFITAKQDEGKIANANISVLVDDYFMESVERDDYWQTKFLLDNGQYITGNSYKARDLFDLIIEGMWRNGEPGILFKDRINDSPYKYSNQEILATNPCAEQPLPFNGCCNLGSIDISKYLLDDLTIDLETLEVSIRLAVRFLDSVIDRTSYPTEEIENWSMENRPIGLGIMGFADYLLLRKVAYGSDQSIEELKFILNFIYKIAEDESICLAEGDWIPKNCRVLPVPRENITLTTIAPTGTISLIAGCSSGIEPIFSEIVVRNDKTGTYSFTNDLAHQPYFRCAVSANGATEVTWEEHIKVLSAAQSMVDSGVSKTINFPQGTHRETIAKAVMLAWKSGCKGIAVYRDKSRKEQVLTPQAIKKDKCPECGGELLHINNHRKCSAECGFSIHDE